MTTLASVRSLAHSLTRPVVSSPLVLALAIFVLALIPRLPALDVFVGPDEFTWDRRSANFARAVTSGNWAETYQDGHPGVTLMWLETIGAGVRYGYQRLVGHPVEWERLIGPEDSMANLSAKREILAGSNALLLVLAVLLVYRLFGHATAWLFGFLLAFDPFLLTESRALRSEGILTGLTMLALLALLLYLQRRKLGYSALAGALTALAILSKISAAALLPVAGIMIGGVALFNRLYPMTKRLQAMVVALLVFGSVLLLTIFVVWPALWVSPTQVVQQMSEYVGVRVEEGNVGGKSFLLGEELTDEEVGPLFYPTVLLYRTSPVLWLGLILLIGGVIWSARGRAETFTQKKTARILPVSPALLSAILLFLLVYLALITRSTLKYDRFIIPMLPPLNLLTALGLVAAWRWLTARDSQQSKILNMAWLPALLVLGLQMVVALPHHPYYYTYWNPILGGLRQAVHILPVGAGEGLDQVAAYLNHQPEAQNIKLALANSTKIDPVFSGQTIPLDNQDGRWVQSDYTLIYISQLQRGKHDPNILNYLERQPPVFTVTLHGLEYAWLYPGPAAHYYGGGFKLEGRGTLFGYNFCPLLSPCKSGAGSEVELAAGDTLSVTLFWRNEGQLETDRFFVRLMDLDGYVWAEAIAQPRPGFEEANRQREAILESEAILTLPVGMPPGDYFFKPGFRTDSGEIIGHFELPEDTKPIHVTRAAAYPQTFQPPHPFRLAVNDDLALAGYNLEPEKTAPGTNVWVTLYWQALANVTHDYVILLRLLDQEGQEAAYWLGRPVRSGYPSTEWRSGQIVQDPWLLNLPAEVKPGIYQLEVAVFDAATEAEVSRQGLSQIPVIAQ
ncbi:MAG: glycosyltransferase family 39 protein [Anaerolineae bacterium]|nr:glycosyltransferase family 39 protein [Anaerolineae bacterium]